jgi:AcrR family transcriptional regulator
VTSNAALPISRGDGTKRAILEAAVSLYARRGVKGTGLTAIGQAAGVTHAGVLYHFGSSRKLLLAVLDERDRRFWEETEHTWAGSGLEALGRLPKLAEWNQRNFELAKLFTVLKAENLDPDDEAHRYFLERRRRVRRRIQKTIEDGQRRGEIRPEIDPGLKADEVIAFMDGAQMNAMLDPKVDLVAIFETYTDALVRQLETRRALRRRPKTRARGGTEIEPMIGATARKRLGHR